MYSRKPFLGHALAALFTAGIAAKLAPMQQSLGDIPFSDPRHHSVKRGSRSKYVPHVGAKQNRIRLHGAEKRAAAIGSALAKGLMPLQVGFTDFHEVGNHKQVSLMEIYNAGYVIKRDVAAHPHDCCKLVKIEG